MGNTRELLSKLVGIGERQLENETKAAELLCAFLRAAGIPHDVQTYDIQVPRTRSAILTVDGVSVPCAGTSFGSGVIPDKEIILSSAMPMAESPDLPNINFNPYCSAISKANHYRKPAVAVTHETLRRVLAGKRVRGEVETELVTHTAHNILVGNVQNPAIVVFTHYDSIGPGAFDNASGVIALLDALLERPAMRDTTLCIFSGAEELSTDLPFYWGAGYRRFQDKNPAVLANAASILVADSVGAGAVTSITDPRVIRRAFPIADLETLLPKIQLIAADIEQLMPVYHSELDTLSAIDDHSTVEAVNLLLQRTSQEPSSF